MTDELLTATPATDGDGAPLPPAPEPEPTPLPEDLPLWEWYQEAEVEFPSETPPPAPRFLIQSATDAARLMERIAHFEDQRKEQVAAFDDQLARLKAQIANIEARKADVEAYWTRRKGWYLVSVEMWARAVNAADPKQKTIMLPHGSLKIRAQQPEWTYDDGALLAYLQVNRPELIRTKAEPNKVDLKKAVQVNGAHALDPQTGEIIPGVTITERPPKFELEVAG